MSQYSSGRLEAPPSLPVSPAEQALDVFLAPLLSVLGRALGNRKAGRFRGLDEPCRSVPEKDPFRGQCKSACHAVTFLRKRRMPLVTQTRSRNLCPSC